MKNQILFEFSAICAFKSEAQHPHPFHSLKIGLSHTPTIGVSHTPIIGLSHTDFEVLKVPIFGHFQKGPQNASEIVQKPSSQPPTFSISHPFRSLSSVKNTKFNRKAGSKRLNFVHFVYIIGLYCTFLLKSVGGNKKTSYLCTVIPLRGESENLKMALLKKSRKN